MKHGECKSAIAGTASPIEATTQQIDWPWFCIKATRCPQSNNTYTLFWIFLLSAQFLINIAIMNNSRQDANLEWLSPEDITVWDDFTYENIDAAYGHLLNQDAINSQDLDLDGSQAKMSKESDADGANWVWRYLSSRYPTKYIARHLQESLGVEKYDVTMKPQSRTSADVEIELVTRKPDWSIYLSDPDETLLVWGDNQRNSKWKSDQLACAAGIWIWPFRQLLTYCVNENIRYGFIFTSEELVVLRIYKDTSVSDKRLRWRIQYQSISWETHGDDILTVNMGIWALAMMSLNEHHRPIRSLALTLPLNIWWKDKDDTDSDIFEHHLSGLTQSAILPDGAEVRSRISLEDDDEGSPRDARADKRRRSKR